MYEIIEQTNNHPVTPRNCPRLKKHEILTIYGDIMKMGTNVSFSNVIITINDNKTFIKVKEGAGENYAIIVPEGLFYEIGKR